jgi:hypothetical protein
MPPHYSEAACFNGIPIQACLCLPILPGQRNLIVGPANEVPPHQQLFLERLAAQQYEAGAWNGLEIKEIPSCSEVAQGTRRHMLIFKEHAAVQNQDAMLKLWTKR